MEEYEVDVPVAEIVRWIRKDAGRRRPSLLVRASKEYLLESDFDPEEFGIGENEDVELVSVHGVLEVQSRSGRKDWRLQLKVDDVIGLNPGDGETAYENEDEMSFAQFDEQFLSRGLGEIAITVAAETSQAKTRFNRWLARHMKDDRRYGESCWKPQDDTSGSASSLLGPTRASGMAGGRQSGTQVER